MRMDWADPSGSTTDASEDPSPQPVVEQAQAQLPERSVSPERLDAILNTSQSEQGSPEPVAAAAEQLPTVAEVPKDALAELVTAVQQIKGELAEVKTQQAADKAAARGKALAVETAKKVPSLAASHVLRARMAQKQAPHALFHQLHRWCPGKGAQIC